MKVSGTHCLKTESAVVLEVVLQYRYLCLHVCGISSCVLSCLVLSCNQRRRAQSRNPDFTTEGAMDQPSLAYLPSGVQRSWMATIAARRNLSFYPYHWRPALQHFTTTVAGQACSEQRRPLMGDGYTTLSIPSPIPLHLRPPLLWHRAGACNRDGHQKLQ